MRQLNWADWEVTGAFALAFFGLLTWVIGYAWSTGGEWARTAIGRDQMWLRVSLVVFMAMAVPNSIWAHYPGRDEIRVVVVTTFAMAVVNGCRVLLRAQLARLQRRRDSLVQANVGGQVDGGGEEPA